MKRTCKVAIAALGLFAVAGGNVRASSLLAPGDPIIAIDLDPPTSNSSYPGGEPPTNIVDGTLAKYLNFGREGSGFIVTPAVGATTVQSFQMTTAGDADARDPFSFELWGTNDAIVSADNSTGLGGENWTLIDAFDLTGAFELPLARDTLGPVVPITNASAYSSYKMIYPTLRNAGATNSMQIAEVSFFESNDGTGLDVLNAGDPVLAIHFGPDSRIPGAEGPGNAIDQDVNTKYLNFGKENSGFIVTPASGPNVVRTFQITTANDSESRDPTSWELYGTDDPITSLEHSQGDAENWVLIDSGSVDLPVDRFTPGPFVIVDNDTAYASYRMVFPTLRDAAAGDADSMQYAEVQFFNEAIPEPGTFGLAAIALLACAARFRRKS